MGFTKITGISKHWNPHQDIGKDIPNPVICDSFFDMTKANATTNAELEIILHVWFEMYTTAEGKLKDGDGELFDVQDWTPADDFPGWCVKARDESNKAWDDQLTLIPPSKYDGIDVDVGGVTYRPNVRCRFKMMLGSSKYHHCHVKVAIPKPHPTVPSFKVSMRMWTKDKVTYTVGHRTIHGIMGQVTCAHETGHLLGLQHIGRVIQVKDCNMKTGVGTPKCEYAVNDPRPEITSNIMGSGMEVSEHNALPWQQEMCKHANRNETFGKLDPSDWTAKAASVAPSVLPRSKGGCSVSAPGL